MLSLILYTNRPAELTIALVDSDNADNNGVEVQICRRLQMMKEVMVY